jgi:hypothetical protein
MAFIAHTAPEARSPSKNHEMSFVSSKYSLVGEYKKPPKKNPTHVLQHIIQEIMPEMNLKIGDSGLKKSSPIKAILFLIPAKIEPQTMMLVKPYARKNQINISIFFIIYKVYRPNLNLLNIQPFVAVVSSSMNLFHLRVVLS